MVILAQCWNRCLCLGGHDQEMTGEETMKELQEKLRVPAEMLFVTWNDHFLHPNDSLPNGTLVRVQLRLPGGKGGFGSMLRAIGAQIEKTTNREACRDLSGRRLRDINEEKRLKKWLAKKADREREAEERKLQRLERLKSKPKHDFHDPQYDRERSDLVERVSVAVEEGLKRKPDQEEGQGPSTKKPKALWLGPDEFDTSDSSDEEGACPVDRPSKNLHPASSSGGSEDNDDSSPAAQTSSSSSPKDGCSEQQKDEQNLEPKEEQKIETVEDEQPKELKRNMEESESSGSPTTETSEDKPDDTTKNDECEEQSDCQSSDKVPEEKNDSVSEAKSIPEINKHIMASEQKSENVFKLEEFHLNETNGVEELEELGLEALKTILTHMGLKCGGTLQQRAERLWAVKGLKPEQIDPKLKAKPAKKK